MSPTRIGAPRSGAAPLGWAVPALAVAIGWAGCAAPATSVARGGSEPGATSRARASEPPSTARPEGQVRELLERINRRRSAIGCRPLQWDERLARVALAHSRDMARRGYFSHDSPDGEDPFDRLRRAGIRFRAAAENLAMGQRSAGETFAAWMGSPGHRRNLEDCVQTRVGIAVFRERWTCVLARPPDGPRGSPRRADAAR